MFDLKSKIWFWKLFYRDIATIEKQYFAIQS